MQLVGQLVGQRRLDAIPVLLYEDEGDSYNYEKGRYATIDFEWHDASRTLTIGDRAGAFPGMLAERIFNVVLVSPAHGTGVEITGNPDLTLRYEGEALKATL